MNSICNKKTYFLITDTTTEGEDMSLRVGNFPKKITESRDCLPGHNVIYLYFHQIYKGFRHEINYIKARFFIKWPLEVVAPLHTVS